MLRVCAVTLFALMLWGCRETSSPTGPGRSPLPADSSQTTIVAPSSWADTTDFVLDGRDVSMYLDGQGDLILEESNVVVMRFDRLHGGSGQVGTWNAVVYSVATSVYDIVGDSTNYYHLIVEQVGTDMTITVDSEGSPTMTRRPPPPPSLKGDWRATPSQTEEVRLAIIDDNHYAWTELYTEDGEVLYDYTDSGSYTFDGRYLTLDEGWYDSTTYEVTLGTNRLTLVDTAAWVLGRKPGTSGSGITGTWVPGLTPEMASLCAEGGQQMAEYCALLDTYSFVLAVGGGITVTLPDDNGGSLVYHGTWSVTGDELKITVTCSPELVAAGECTTGEQESVTWKFELSGGRLLLREFYVFERVGGADIAVGMNKANSRPKRTRGYIDRLREALEPGGPSIPN